MKCSFHPKGKVSDCHNCEVMELRTRIAELERERDRGWDEATKWQKSAQRGEFENRRYREALGKIADALETLDQTSLDTTELIYSLARKALDLKEAGDDA